MPQRNALHASGSSRALLEGLDDEQRAAVTAPRGPLCVLAGAGTGKTRTITRRIAHLVEAGHVAAGQILAVTFTQRAAGEMRGRLRDLGVGRETGGVQAVTFHAAALRQLRYFWPQLVGDTRWELLDSKFTVVAQAANRARVSTTTDTVRDLASEIEWAKASLITPESYAEAAAKAGRDAPVPADQLAAVYAGYEKLKARPDGSTLLDFDDLLLHTAAAIENSATVAEEFRDRYRCFVVDEYQDVTPLQQRVLDAWVGPRDDLTVVGDANQTIYSFTGATPHYLLGFSRRFPDATVVRLERDYRSTPQVVSLANRVIAAAQGRVVGSKLQLVGQRADGPAPRFTEHDDEAAEAAATAKSIAALIKEGTPASEIAILYRINAQSEAYEEALTAAAIPFQVRGGEGFFTRQEIRQALIALQRAAERTIDDIPVHQQVLMILEPLGWSATEPQGAQAKERWESLRALAQLAEDECAREPGLDLPGLVRELRLRSDARHPPTVQGVTLASLHAAKGLEWDAVFLVGLADGTLPISHALARSGDIEAIEEERRLLYVGVTRARVHLMLSWALARAAGGRKGRKHSRFLNGIAPTAQLPASATPRRRGGGTRCRICNAPLTTPAAVMLRRCETCPSHIDEDLLAALKDWRLRTAKDAKVPAFVVFTDNTLIAIAELLPGDDAALVSIPGIGARKLEQYGHDVLQLVRARSS